MAEHKRKTQGSKKGRKEKLVKVFLVLVANYTGNITHQHEIQNGGS